MSGAKGRSRPAVWLVFVLFFVISFVSNVLGPLVPVIITDFSLSLTMAGVLPFAFFIAYGVTSIPAGFLVEKWGDKTLIVAALLLGSVGALAFAGHPGYGVAIASLFLIGACMAALQVVINPLLRVAGGEEHFAWNSAAAQMIFGLASFAGPWFFSWLLTHLKSQPPHHHPLILLLAGITPAAVPWAAVYWVFAFLLLATAVYAALQPLPRVVRTEEESAGTHSMYRALARDRTTWLFFLGIVAYVGCEQGSSNWISQFLLEYHHFDAATDGARAVAWFWGLMALGCIPGLWLLRRFDSRRVLVAFSLAAMLMLSLALFGPAGISYWAFPAIGFFASIMWPTVFSLALNSVPRFHGPFSGILCTGIVGGAVFPLLIGKIGDHFGLRAGMTILYLSFAYVLGVGLWARPLIGNALSGGRAGEAGT